MTTHKSPQAKAWYQAFESDEGNLQGAIGYLPASVVTLAQNDIIQMIKVPLGAIVVDCILETGAIGANVLAAVGDDLDVDRYILDANVAAASLSRKSRTAPLQGAGVPHAYVAGDTIDVKLTNAAPASDKAIRLDVFYICGTDVTP